MGPIKNHRFQYSQTVSDGRFHSKVPRCSLLHNKLSIKRFPVITMTIATVYTCFFFFAPGEMIARLCSLPLNDFTLLHLIRATVAGIFLHAGLGHFTINMVFLWVFGTFIESRLTPGHYLSAVLLGSVLSRLISMNLLVSQIGASSINMLWCPPAGASGAIAGLMGCFLMSFLGGGQSGRGRIHGYALMPLRGPIGAMALVVIFLAGDLAGATAAVFDPSGVAIFWGHTGGMLGGLVLAVVFSMQDDNPGQRREDVGKCLSAGLKRGADDRCHQERVVQTPVNASMQVSSHFQTPIEGNANRNPGDGRLRLSRLEGAKAVS